VVWGKLLKLLYILIMRGVASLSDILLRYPKMPSSGGQCIEKL